MANVGGFAGYSEIAQTERPFGSLRSGIDGWKDFFHKTKVQNNLDDAADAIAANIESGDYDKAAAAAMRAGDYGLASDFANLASDAEARAADTAYRNAMLGMRAADAAQEQDAAARALDTEARAYANALANTDDLLELNKKAGRFATGDFGKWLSRNFGGDRGYAWDEFKAKMMQRYGPYRKLFTGSGATSDADLAVYLEGIGLNDNTTPEARERIIQSMDRQIAASLDPRVLAAAQQMQGMSKAMAGNQADVGLEELYNNL